MFDFVEQMKRKNRERIVLFVSHKLSSSVSANKILFIQNGQLINVGNHDYLLNNCNEYKELFMLQARKYLKRGNENNEN